MSRPGQLAWQRLRADRVGMVSLWLVLASLALVAAAALGLAGARWDSEVAASHAPPAWALALGWEAPVAARSGAADQGEPTGVPGIDDPIGDSLAAARADLAGRAATAVADPLHPAWLVMGADGWGRDVLAKTLKGAQTSILVGLGAALFATLLGTALGMLAGFVVGWLDDLLNWVYNVFTSVPTILLILAIAAALGQRSLTGVVLILACTSWTGVFRLIRAAYLQHSARDYVRAARAIASPPRRRMDLHYLPNVAHLVPVQFSLLTITCIPH